MKTILIVDDDDCDLFLFERTLAKAGYECEILRAVDGINALELLKTTQATIDLILLDINMPRMNGHEFIIEYSQLDLENVPVVVMLTSSDQGPAFEETMKFDFVKDYFLKPFKPDDLPEMDSIIQQSRSASNLKKVIEESSP